MELPAIFIFTHDAMGDGEDGPTHQPVEQLLSLRAIPGLVTIRPGDANEVVEAYRYVMQLRHQPAALVLSRQPLPTLDRSRYAPAWDTELIQAGSAPIRGCRAYYHCFGTKASQCSQDDAFFNECFGKMAAPLTR
jgi:transketolase